MPTQDDQQLVQALQRGDRYACQELIEQYGQRLYNVALRLTGHPNEAEEVLQETFINACRGVENFAGRASLATWLHRIATNNGLMRLRRQQAETVSLDAPLAGAEADFLPERLEHWDWNPETVTLTGELHRAMDEAVAALPPPLREAFVLRDLEGLSTQEAADALDISPGNLKVRLHRARLQLREHLAAYFSEHPVLPEADNGDSAGP